MVHSLNDVDWSTLPAPQDDGAAEHLTGTALPDIALAATSGTQISPAQLNGLQVLYIYPMTGRPDVALPEGWDMIPGARGCTPQSCAFRDHFAELRALGVNHLFGLSTQTPDEQAEAAERLHLPFPLLSDEALAFSDALGLPRFEAGGLTRLKRVTLIVEQGRIVHMFYPVFPPDRNAGDVIAWLSDNRKR